MPFDGKLEAAGRGSFLYYEADENYLSHNLLQLKEHNVQLHIIGDKSRLHPELQEPSLRRKPIWRPIRALS